MPSTKSTNAHLIPPVFDPLVGHLPPLNSRGLRVRYNDAVEHNDGEITSILYAPERDLPHNTLPPQWRYPVFDGSSHIGPIPDVPAAPHLIPGGAIPYTISRRRGSDDSDITLNEEPIDTPKGDAERSAKSRSSAIYPPPAAHIDGQEPNYPPGLVAPLRIHKKKPAQLKSLLKPARSSHTIPGVVNPEPASADDKSGDGEGMFQFLADLYISENYVEADYPEEDIERSEDIKESIRAGRLVRTDSDTSDDSAILDPDDPTVTGVIRRYIDDREDVEKNVLRQMSYRARRKERARLRIEFNITCKLLPLTSYSNLD